MVLAKKFKHELFNGVKSRGVSCVAFAQGADRRARRLDARARAIAGLAARGPMLGTLLLLLFLASGPQWFSTSAPAAAAPVPRGRPASLPWEGQAPPAAGHAGCSSFALLLLHPCGSCAGHAHLSRLRRQRSL